MKQNCQNRYRNKFRIPVFLSFLLFACISANTQEIYDLNRCITTGIDHNFSIMISRNRQEVATNNFTPGNAGYLPTLSLNSKAGGTLTGTRQNLASGGESTSNGVHNISANAGANLSWTLFNGFSVRSTYQKLNELKLVGELNTQMSIENLVADIVSEYYYYIQQVNLYKNLEYAVALSRERVRIDEERYLLGSGSKLQLLQSVVYLNADSSRYSKQKEVLRASQIRLNKLMANEDIGALLIVKDTAIAIKVDLLFDQLLKETLEKNTSLLISKRNQIISEYDLKIITSRSYPYLDFSSGYNRSFNKYGSGSVSSQHSGALSYGLTLGVDLYDGMNRKRETANARLDVESKKYQYKEIEQQVRADLITIFYAYQNNLGLLKLEQQNLSAARENLEIALERYKLGNLSGLELREVQKSYLDAEERLISVQYQTKLAEISLLQISGRVMDYI